MKHFFLLLITLFVFSQAQGQDFNYTFYPAPKYAKYTELHKLDTVKKVFVLVPDSVKSTIALIVEKTGDQIVIRDQANISAPIYTATVKFQGLLNDGKNSLFYRSTAPEAEAIIVNPTLGFVVVIYQKCFPKPELSTIPIPKANQGEKITHVVGESEKMCNVVNHYFGNIALKTYKP